MHGVHDEMSKPFKLQRGEFCIVHRSLFCCGREMTQKAKRRFGLKERKAGAHWVPVPGQWGVSRMDDPHHPRGYRERRDAKAMRMLLNAKIVEQDRRCAICGELFDDYRQIVAEHKEPKGMGGARRDDHPDNIQAAHQYPCNLTKGSKRIA
jgi:hypothetical protein